VARRIEITSSKKNATKRATKLATLKAGKAVGPKKPAALKKVGAVAGLLPALVAGSCVSSRAGPSQQGGRAPREDQFLR